MKPDTHTKTYTKNTFILHGFNTQDAWSYILFFNLSN